MKGVVASIFIALAVLVGCVTTQQSVQTTTAPVTIAVWDFEDLSPYKTAKYSFYSTVLADACIEKLKEIKGVEAVERSRLLQVLEEQALGSSELADESTRLRLGKLLGAKRMIFGTYQVIGGQVRIDMRLVDVETSKVLGADEKTLQRVQTFNMVQSVRSMVEELVEK